VKSYLLALGVKITFAIELRGEHALYTIELDMVFLTSGRKLQVPVLEHYARRNAGEDKMVELSRNLPDRVGTAQVWITAKSYLLALLKCYLTRGSPVAQSCQYSGVR
jgi:hypothetical protein